jgi:hypothetical protein
VSELPPRPPNRDTLLDADALAPAPAPPPPPPPPPPAARPSNAASLPPPAAEPEADDDPDTLVSRSPDARGTFAETPLVYILVHALDRRMTGALSIRHADSPPARIVLDDGAVVRVDGGELHRLGEEALLVGVCSEAQLAGALVASNRERTRLGVELVAQAGLRPELIRRLLLIQAAKRIARLVNLPESATYTLHLGHRSREAHEPWAPLDLVLAAVRAWSDRPRIHGTMRHIGARTLTLHANANLTELVTLPNERTALDAIRSQDCTLESLYRLAGGGLSSLIYTLAVTRQFAFSAEKGAPMGRLLAPNEMAKPADAGGAPPPSQPPSSAGPLATSYELEQSSPPAIVQTALLERPITESFGLADTSPGAFIKRTTAPYPIEPTHSTDAVRPASAPPASPLPLPTPPPAPARPLSLPPKQARAASVPPPPQPPPAPERLGPGADDFELAEAAFAKHDYRTAEMHASKAAYADPKNPDYAALFAWVCAHGGDENAVPEGVRMLTRILEEHPKCESALLYRGTLLRQAGKDKAALRDFVMVLYQNPSHPQALLEVRELRKKKK